MNPTATPPAAVTPQPSPRHDTMAEVVETLAPLERRAGSPAEREAAEWIARRLNAGGARATVEEELFHDGYAKQLLPLGASGAVAGLLALGGRRRLAAALGLAAGAALIDDVSNGTRLWRKLIGRPRPTWNVVAEAGDVTAERTLIVMAHHDAAPTGQVFDQSHQEWLAERFPTLVAKMETSIPLWWGPAGGPVLSAFGALTGNRKLAAAGTALSAATVALGVDIARSPVVPGANDNLSAVAALVELAERLQRAPMQGVRVLLVSCGAEEVLQGGIYGFAARHFPHLSQDRTWVLNLDTIGSPELILVEGEGPFRMEEYCDPTFRTLICEVADRIGRPLRRGPKSRASSDSVIPSRAGYPTAMLASWDPRSKVLSNYHLMSDTPDNLCYGTIDHAVAIAEELGRALGAQR